MAEVFAQRSCATEWQGRPVHVHAGEAWDADDPFVAAKPDLFGPPARVRRTTREPAVPVVETATRAPGEVRRGPGRPRKSQP